MAPGVTVALSALCALRLCSEVLFHWLEALRLLLAIALPVLAAFGWFRSSAMISEPALAQKRFNATKAAPIALGSWSLVRGLKRARLRLVQKRTLPAQQE